MERLDLHSNTLAGVSRRLCRVPPGHHKEEGERSGAYLPQPISREEVFAALAAHGVERDGAHYADFECAKQLLANICFVDSADYDQIVGFIEEFLGM